MTTKKQPISGCATGTHAYKPAQLGRDREYYEHLDIAEVEESVQTWENQTTDGKTISVPKTITKKVIKVIDAEPGKHYQTWICTKCGGSIEVVVKYHGPLYEKAVKDPKNATFAKNNGSKYR